MRENKQHLCFKSITFKASFSNDVLGDPDRPRPASKFYVWNIFTNMVFQFSILLRAMLITSIVTAASQKRYTISGVSRGVICGGATFSKLAVDSAAQLALEKHVNNQIISSYPHEFRNNENLLLISQRCRKPYQEFPILVNGKIYDGANPGAYRVVIGSIRGSQAKYCGVIYHLKKSGDFRLCKEGKSIN
ncbi:hypothetical protein K7432_008890 [Basidiobolus ranarum]|uniref:Uncharacterized protein n=1 Tax=Basidiobolus ranarum TaxID=34480 RepID=A0ABR2WR40_9FUNG